jgi:uncharacterized protein (DUF2267 family)
MDDGYRVAGGVGPALPGIVGPAQVDGRMEWVPVPRAPDLLDMVEARLGSEGDLHRVVLGVLAPLRPALEGRPLASLLARLPLSLARELAAGDAALGEAVRAPASAKEYVLEVSRLVLQPPWRAAPLARAVLAAARAALPAEEAQAIAARLPPDLAELWTAAR